VGLQVRGLCVGFSAVREVAKVDPSLLQVRVVPSVEGKASIRNLG